MEDELFTPVVRHTGTHVEFSSGKLGVKPSGVGQVCFRFEVRKTSQGFPVEKVNYGRVDGTHDWHETGRRMETVFDRRCDALDYSDMEQGHHRLGGRLESLPLTPPTRIRKDGADAGVCSARPRAGAKSMACRKKGGFRP